MEKYIKSQNPNNPKVLETNKLVTKIVAVPSIGTGQKRRASKMEVHVLGEADPRTYEHVIATPTLSCLRTMNLDNAGLTFFHANALRQLQYGPATKVGVKFKRPWWTDYKDLNGNQVKLNGGQSYTDRPVRTVVYPSYGPPDSEHPTHCLIASYCWTYDAIRLGALFHRYATVDESPDLKAEVEEQLKNVVLRDLAAIHNVSFQTLEDEYDSLFAFNWSNNPFTQGN
jgi:monoamine oxidase